VVTRSSNNRYRGITLGDLGLTAFYAVVALMVGIAEAWLIVACPVSMAVQWSVFSKIIAVAVFLVGLSVLVCYAWREYFKGHPPGRPGTFVFFGVLLFLGAGSLVLSYWFFKGMTLVPPPAKPGELHFILEVSPEVLYPYGNRTWAGPKVFEKNGLAKAAQLVSREFDRFFDLAGAQDATRHRPSWEVLINWAPVPSSGNSGGHLMTPRLHFVHGDGMLEPVEVMDGLEQTLVAQLQKRTVEELCKDNVFWRVRASGLPGKLNDLHEQRGKNDVFVMLTTGDFDSPHEMARWQAAAQRAGRSKTIVFMLPSLPRSGDSRRFAAAKAALLESGGAGVVWLQQPPADKVYADEEYLALLDGRAPVYETDPRQGRDNWYQPESFDLDSLRRKYYSTVPDSSIDSTLFDGLLEASNITKPEKPRREAASARDVAWTVAIVAIALISLCSFHGIANSTLAADNHVKAPSWRCRFVCLLVGAIGLALTAFMVCRLCPGLNWRQNGRPAAAVWSFCATWGILVLWPMRASLGYTRILGGFGLACILCLPAIVFSAGVLLGFCSQGMPWLLGLVLLLPTLWCTIRVATLPIKPGTRLEFTREPTTVLQRPLCWTTIATFVALSVAVAMTGFVPAPGNDLRQAAVLGILPCGLLVAAVACSLRTGPWSTRR